MIRSARHIFRLASLCVVVLTMVGSLSSCRRYAGDEAAVGSALAMADSLRYDAPEAADSIIRSLDADSLGSRANAALYALLANEVGRYDDQVAAADSLVDIAVGYYRLRSWLSDSNTRIYARALMQKARIYMINQEYDLASEKMQRSYSIMDSADYSLLGDFHRQLATIHAYAKSDYSILITHRRLSAENYGKAEMPIQTIEMLNETGATYRITRDMDSSLYYLDLAKQMLTTIDDETQMAANVGYRAGRHYMMHNYRDAIAEARCALSISDGYENVAETKYVLCSSYLRLGLLDSARIVAHTANFDTTSIKENLMYVNTLLFAAEAGGDYKSALNYLRQVNDITYNELNIERTNELLQIQKKYDMTKLKASNSRLQLWVVLMLAIVIVMVCIMLYRRSLIKRKQLQHELLVAELQQNLALLEENLRQQRLTHDSQQDESGDSAIDAHISNARFNEVYRRYLEVFYKISELSDFISSDSNNLNLIKKMVSSLADDKVLSQDFISEVRSYVNARYDNVLERLRASHPNIKDDDIDLMALMLAGYNTSMIVICMGYADRASLNNKRSRLKKRLGINVSVSKYLQQLTGIDSK
ncbi:MAG: hypothetical protein IKU16_07000 [Muribaculaceae bacterium]|nr:hypothetical protein [Muribaculaceae bacterium]